MLRFIVFMLTMAAMSCAQNHKLSQEIICFIEITDFGHRSFIFMPEQPYHHVYIELLEVYLRILTNNKARLEDRITALKIALAKCDEHPSEHKMHKAVYGRAYQLLLQLQHERMQRLLKPVYMPIFDHDRFKRSVPLSKVQIPAPIAHLTEPTPPPSACSTAVHRYWGENPFAPDSWLE